MRPMEWVDLGQRFARLTAKAHTGHGDQDRSAKPEACHLHVAHAVDRVEGCRGSMVARSQRSFDRFADRRWRAALPVRRGSRSEVPRSIELSEQPEGMPRRVPPSVWVEECALSRHCAPPMHHEIQPAMRHPIEVGGIHQAVANVLVGRHFQPLVRINLPLGLCSRCFVDRRFLAQRRCLFSSQTFKIEGAPRRGDWRATGLKRSPPGP